MSDAGQKAASTFREWNSAHSLRWKLRDAARSAIIFGASLRARVPLHSSWIRFPYYHHVFDDERRGFEAHLRYMQDLGEIVGLDDAIALLESSDPIDGRYFCITFDDGFKNCLTNAVPILVDHGVSAAFFVPTRYVGTSPEKDRDLMLGFYEHGKTLMEFLDWDDCREIVRAGMTIGSHTVSHPRLLDLQEETVERELEQSKAIIERELGVPCDHFCCPTGRPGLDFDVERDPEIARRLGYRSFLTTRRGSIRRKPTPFMVDRDHTLAIWGLYQLRYFFSR